MSTDTPRTKAEERWAEWNGEDFKCVHVEFARELERELAKAKRIAEDLQSDEWWRTQLCVGAVESAAAVRARLKQRKETP